MFVTEELGAVSRTVFESARTLFVWLGDLLLYYTPLGFGRLGEGWDRSSYLQVRQLCSSPRKATLSWVLPPTMLFPVSLFTCEFQACIVL
jgi:hypothetical protein